MLVVYRHVVVGMRRSGFEVSFLMYNIQEIFYNFRMPVFFVLSGIFIGGSLKKRTRGLVMRDRAFTVLYPYLLWGTIMVIMQILFSQFTNAKRDWTDLFDIILQPRNIDHFWYLLALFNTSMIYILVSYINRSPWFNAFVALCFHLVTTIPGVEKISLVYDSFYYYSYFFVGIVISAYILNKEKNGKLLNVKNLVWLFPLCIIGQWFWFSQWSLGKAYWRIEHQFFLLFFMINLLACYLIYIISYKISQTKKSDWLAYLGKHSLYIYIMHVFVASFFRNIILKVDAGMNPWAVMFICWSFGLLVPVLLFQGLKRIGFEWLFSLKTKRVK